MCVRTRARGSVVTELLNLLLGTCPGHRAGRLVDRHSLVERLGRARERLGRRTPGSCYFTVSCILSVYDMSKRELETLARVAIDLEGPRTKRRRETPAEETNGDVKVEEDEDAKAARLAAAICVDRINKTGWAEAEEGRDVSAGGAGFSVGRGGGRTWTRPGRARDRGRRCA